MRNKKFLAKSIALSLILAMPYSVVNAANISTEVNNKTITGWGEQTVVNGGVTHNTTVDNTDGNNACQIVQNGGKAYDTILVDQETGVGGRQNVVEGGYAEGTKNR